MVSKETQIAYLHSLERIFGAEVPAELRFISFFEIVDTSYDLPDFFLCGHFQLADDLQTRLEFWPGDAAQRAGEQLRLFLIDGCAVLYALWSYQGQPFADAPVVYLDDEGVGSAVVAGNLRDFLSLMAAGFDRVSPQAIAHPDEHEPVDTSACPIFNALGIAPAPDPLRLIEEVQAAHPDFSAWVEALLTAASR